MSARWSSASRRRRRAERPRHGPRCSGCCCSQRSWCCWASPFPRASTRSSGAPRRSSLADPALMDALRAGAGGSVDADVGPRPSDLTVRLGRTGDLPAAAAVLIGPHSMALATVVATDETATPDGDLKVRYVFEPTAPGAPDRFVTLLISVDCLLYTSPSP